MKLQNSIIVTDVKRVTPSDVDVPTILWEDVNAFNTSYGFHLYHHTRFGDYSWAFQELQKYFPNTEENFSLLDVGGAYSMWGYFVKHRYPNVHVTVIDTFQDAGGHKCVPPPEILNGSTAPKYINMNFNSYNPDEKFDIVTAISSLEHFRTIEESFTHFIEMVRPKGLLIVTTDIGNFNEYDTTQPLPKKSGGYTCLLNGPKLMKDIFNVDFTETFAGLSQASQSPRVRFLFMSIVKE